MNVQEAFVVKNNRGEYYYGKSIFGKNLRKANMYSSRKRAEYIANNKRYEYFKPYVIRVEVAELLEEDEFYKEVENNDEEPIVEKDGFLICDEMDEEEYDDWAVSVGLI